MADNVAIPEQYYLPSIPEKHYLPLNYSKLGDFLTQPHFQQGTDLCLKAMMLKCPGYAYIRMRENCLCKRHTYTHTSINCINIVINLCMFKKLALLFLVFCFAGRI